MPYGQLLDWIDNTGSETALYMSQHRRHGNKHYLQLARDSAITLAALLVETSER